ncbi:YegP family protein [Pseudarthrobacter sp. So.54]
MAGYFEVVDAPDGGYRIRMLDGAGSLMAVTITFPTKRAAVAGIAQAREIAGTGLIRDRSAGRQASQAATPLPRVPRRTTGGASRGTTLSGGSLAAGKRARAHH